MWCEFKQFTKMGNKFGIYEFPRHSLRTRQRVFVKNESQELQPQVRQTPWLRWRTGQPGLMGQC